jgi:hypothetical protein
MPVLIAFSTLILIGFLIFKLSPSKEKKWLLPTSDFPQAWREILKNDISFYRSLNASDKERFEFKINEFLLNCKVTGVRTKITDYDRILVASSAVIPIFGFNDWQYHNLQEVLLYPTMFNHDFETEGKDRRIMGMVGNGYMEGHMILSQQSLKHGFKNESDKKNTAIHEFVHLIDKKDGPIDGIPSALMEKQYAIPWIDFINQKMNEIYEGESDINPYAGTNHAEFFSVASEYFFERPKLLKKKHPDLYDHLEKYFRQDMAAKNLSKTIIPITRNSPCSCKSGIKYKDCCGSAKHLNNKTN